MGLRDLWYENTIIYCLDVETYMDSNGDGVGDFQGLAKRLDYLAGLGVTCLWLMPFYPTPNRDDGYDVMDYYAIDPRVGSFGDFVEFVGEARERGIRVIVDLVPNHTSDQHPWFQEARRNPESRYRDYYVWREDDPGDTSALVAFPGQQDAIWRYDKEAGAYYLHHFYDFQPDLNITNPELRAEIRKIMGFWLQLGISGFRLDAVPFLISTLGLEHRLKPEDPHAYLREMQQFLALRTGSGVFLGEVDVGLSTVADYFGGGNEIQMLFNFLVNRSLFLALAQQTADPLQLSLQELPAIPGRGQWVNFLRHHDELNLSRLTQQQRDEVFAAFGPDANMQIYDRGLRRRLAPMFGGDLARLKLAYSLMFSLPGAPIIFYGEEIGMGENLDLPERFSVRTPMQWSKERNGGFSKADPNTLVRPMRAKGPFGYEIVNVAQQRTERDSLLNWMAQLIRTRKECPEVGSGDSHLIQANHPSVFVLRSHYDGSIVYTVHNLSAERAEVRLNIEPGEADDLIDLFADQDYEPFSPKTLTTELEGYGYRWMRVGSLHH